MFSMQSVSQNPIIAIFQWLSAASLNLGQSKNGALWNGLNDVFERVENIFEKEQIMVTSIFLLFPKHLLKPPFSMLLKVRIMWKRVKVLN